MTDEEIDKMADDFVNSQEFTKVYGIVRKAECGAFWRNGFIAGLKARTQWHDLRKNPNDLPKENGNYIVCYLDTTCERHSFELSFVDYFEDRHWIDEDNHNYESYDEGVIAWCELPQFKE